MSDEGPKRTAEDLGTVLNDEQVETLVRSMRTEIMKWPEETRQHAGAVMIVFDDKGYLCTANSPGVDIIRTLALALHVEMTKEPGLRAKLGDDGVKIIEEDTRQSVSNDQPAAANPKAVN